MNRLLLFLLFFLLNCWMANGQKILWQKTVGGNKEDKTISIRQTSDGGFVSGGWSSSDISGDKTDSCRGNMDYWIVKFDAYGVVQWDKTYGGSAVDIINTIQQTADGGYICGGVSGSGVSGDKTEGNIGLQDLWILKLDATGAIQWQNAIGGTMTESIYSIVQTADGGYICGASSGSNISGDKTENTNGLQDFWVVKLDAAGNIEWQNTIGGSADDYLYTVLPTPDGGYICGGRSMSGISGDKTEINNGASDFWVVKLDAAGNILWQNSFGGDGSDDLYELILTQDGGYLTGGRSFSTKSGDKTEESMGLFDYWVVKLDSSGNIQWQNSIGGSSMDELSTLTGTFDNGFLCGGASQSSITGDKNEICQGHYDYWIVKLNSNGQVVWQNTIGGSNMDYLGWIEPTGENDFLCGGFSSSNISGDKTENCSGASDMWIIKISGKMNLITGTAFADLNSSGLKDPGEPIIPGLRIADIYSGNFNFTGTDGFYAVSLEDTGNYEITAPSLSYFTAVPSGYTGSFSQFLETDSLNDFAFKPTGTFNDLCISSTPVTAFRSGMNATYRINYSNSGTTTLNPTVIFYPDSNLSFVSSVPTVSSITQDSMIWNFGPLPPFESGQIMITMQVDSGLPIGTLINSGAVVEPLAGDANLLCNQSFWEVVTIGSYDPNDIMVSRDTLYDFEITSPAFLEYVVRFQNTGNDTAFFVSVNNKIAPGLNLNSFEFIAASHPCSIEYQSYDSTLKFIFNNILLPDSNVNQPGSNGFVRYRIQPHTTLVPGDIISNSADIIFDFNAPVATNSALTEIVLYTSLLQYSHPGFAVYPNPVTNVVNVVFNVQEKQNVAVALFNVYGQKIQELFSGSLEPGSWHKVFPLENLPAGVYVITVNGSSLWGKKLIKL